MKKAILILGIFLCVLTVRAQKDFYYEVFTVDTIVDATDLYFTFPDNLNGVYEYEWQVLIDSMTGGTQGTCYIQSAEDNYGEDYVSVTSKTLTIAGAATQTGGFITGVAYGSNNRLYVDASGTQTTKITVTACYKKVQLGTRGRGQDFWYETWYDSTDAAESVYFEPNFTMEGRYYYSWSIIPDENSGSATSTVALQEGCDNQGTLYYGLSTLSAAHTADGSTRWEGTAYGTNQRMKATQSTTGKWYYETYVVYKKIP